MTTATQAQTLSQQLKSEIEEAFFPADIRSDYWEQCRWKTVREADPALSLPERRTVYFENLLLNYPKKIYDSDYIAGSRWGVYHHRMEESPVEADWIVHLRSRDFNAHNDHCAPGYELLLEKGVGGIIREASQNLEKHPADSQEAIFLRCVIRAYAAFGRLLLQYAAAAREKYDQTGQSRFLQMEEDLTHLASHPAQSFRQGVQLVWLCHMTFMMEPKVAMAFGRMDQYLYPLYAQDRTAGRLTREEAVDYLQAMMAKLHETYAASGNTEICNLTIGGQKADGSSAVNDLSYDILEAVRRVRIPDVNLSARMDARTSKTFYRACLDVIRTGIGFPSLFNDDVLIPYLNRELSVPLADARNYCLVGCIETYLPGMQPPWADCRLNTMKALEYTINDGRDMLTGSPDGVQKPTADLSSMEQLLERFEENTALLTRSLTAALMKRKADFPDDIYYSPFLSGMFYGCLESGRDLNDGGCRYPTKIQGIAYVGIATAADSLIALEKLCFDEKRYTLSQLAGILCSDFAGQEELRQYLKNRLPKYGNDLDQVDRYARWFSDMAARVCRREGDFGPVKYVPLIGSNTSNIACGTELAASPDGRKAGEPVSNTASPSCGAEVNGPTAVINSVTKPDFTQINCSNVNMKFSPQFFEGEENLEKLAVLYRSFIEKGGEQVQINVISPAMLLDAFHHPEQHRSLMVRVSGFSAYFVTLPREVQQEIIQRAQVG